MGMGVIGVNIFVVKLCVIASLLVVTWRGDYLMHLLFLSVGMIRRCEKCCG